MIFNYLATCQPQNFGQYATASGVAGFDFITIIRKVMKTKIFLKVL
jgi:hypothetical protein